VLPQPVEGDEDPGGRPLELGVERGYQVVDAVLVGLVAGGEEDSSAALSHARLEAGQDPRRQLPADRELRLRHPVAGHQVEALQAVEEVLAEVEPPGVVELAVDDAEGEALGVVLLLGEEHLVAGPLVLVVGAGLAEVDWHEVE